MDRETPRSNGSGPRRPLGRRKRGSHSDWDGEPLDEIGWRVAVRSRIETLDWAAAEADVAPFLEPGPAASLFGRTALERLLDSG